MRWKGSTSSGVGKISNVACISGSECNPAAVTSANINGRRQTQLSKRKTLIPCKTFGPEIDRHGALGKNSGNQVVTEKKVSRSALSRERSRFSSNTVTMRVNNSPMGACLADFVG